MLNALRNILTHIRADRVAQLFLTRVMAPLLVVHLLMRTHRVVRHVGDLGVLDLVDVYKADLGFHLGAAGFGLALLWALASRPRARRVAFIGVQLLFLFWMLLEIAAHNFFLVTGTELDFFLVHYAFTNGAATWSLITKSTPWWIYLLMTVGSVGVLALPWVPRGMRAWWRAARRADVRPDAASGETPDEAAARDGEGEEGEARDGAEAETPSASTAPTPKIPRRVLGAALACGAAGMSLALAPAISIQDVNFARPATLGVVLSGLDFAKDLSRGSVKNARFASADVALRRAPGAGSPPNLVVILLESTRARSVTPYNPKLRTTLFLDELAKSSAFMERAYAVVPHTSKALVASLCGVEPYLEQPISEASPGGMPTRCLARMLADAGYRTAFFQSATQRFEYRRQLVENMGYHDFTPLERMSKRSFSKANYFGLEDMVMLKPSDRWVDLHAKKNKKPIFLTYLTLTPHHNYLAPRRFGYEKFVKNRELNNYLNSVRYVDFFVKNVVEMFKEKGLYKNTVFIVLGDHGEGFGEHGRRQHDNVIYEEGMHIPMLIHDGRAPKGRRIGHPVNQLDLQPTAAKLLGFSFDEAAFRGRDMLSLEEDRTLFGHCWYTRRCMAAIGKKHKVIHHFGRQPDEVFDLDADPMERKSVAKSFAGRQAKLKALKRWRSYVLSAYEQHFAKSAKSAISNEPTNPAHPLNTRFGDHARLVGYDLDPPGPVWPGKALTITYHFEALRDGEPGFGLFVHGVAAGRMRANLDHEPVGGFHPLHRWKKGQFIRDEQKFVVPQLPRHAKTFEINLGMYHKKSGKRLPITGSPGDNGTRAAQILSVPIRGR